MASGERRFVQFPHHGDEHVPDVGTLKRWNAKDRDHKRKFLALAGRWCEGSRERTGGLRAWGEWEPESEVVRALKQPDARYPSYLWRPYYQPKADYSRLHNTDPFIYGGFYYANCKQGSSASLEGLRLLGPGSVITFGSKTRTGWVIDTVLVVRDCIDYDYASHREVLRGAVPDAYWEVTLAPTFTSDWNRSQRFRLYRGATPSDPLDEMFSFFPAVLDDGSDEGFPRPAIELPEHYFSPGLTPMPLTYLDPPVRIPDMTVGSPSGSGFERASWEGAFAGELVEAA